MLELIPDVTLIACIAAAIAAHLFAWQVLGEAERLPLAVYSGSYLITSVIGATIIGLIGVAHLETLNGGLSTVHIRSVGDSEYWLLTYLPLIIPALIVACLARRRSGSQPKPLLAADYCYPAVWLVVFCGAACYCTMVLMQQGFDVSLGSWSRLAGEFTELMILRQDIRESVGWLFTRMLYGGLPALSFAALYQWYRHRTLTWAVLCAVAIPVTCWFSLVIILKGICLVFVAGLGAALIELKVARYRMIAAVAVVCFVAFTIMQHYMLGDWNLWQSLSHVVHRMAVSIPYYLNVYPELMPYQGIDLGLWVFGFGNQTTDTLDVFTVMYPNVTYVTGNAAAPAHVALYSQAGMAGAIGSMVVIGLAIAAVVEFRRRIGGPITFAIYVQALVTVYYATQISLVDLGVSSFAFTWCGLTLAPLWFGALAIRGSASRPAGFPAARLGSEAPAA